MDGTILQQGSFASDGTSKDLNIRSDVDFMRVMNLSVVNSDQTTAVGVEYFWQRGMDEDEGIEYKKSDSDNADNMTQSISTGGFTLLDTSKQSPGSLNSTITAISAAGSPIVTNSGVNGLSKGDVVRLIDVAGSQQLGGLDFTVGNISISDTTFSLDYMTQIVAGTTGSWRKINFDPQFYPTKRTITHISKGQTSVVTLSVKHGLTVGQSIKFNVDPIFGMSEINGLTGEITVISTANNSITVNIDSSGFSTFVFPLDADVPFTRAEIVPIGQAAIEANINSLDGAIVNTSLIGMRLAAGIHSPAGSDGDIISWRAGKSFSVNNEI